MKSLLTIFLLTSITVQSFAPSAMLSLFYANRKAIADRFCVNKAKPMMKCNGKCYLKKQMEKSSKEDGSQLPGMNIRIDAFVLGSKPMAFEYKSQLVRHQADPRDPALPHATIAGIFRPPSTLA